MARPKKEPDLAALAAAMGIDPSKLANISTDKWEDDSSYSAEAALSDRKGWYSKNCKGCDRVFQAEYKFVSYCSNRCRKVALQEIGIDWNPEKSIEERWKPYRPSMVVPPEVIIIENEIPEQLKLW
jgi:hypothetical protein